MVHVLCGEISPTPRRGFQDGVESSLSSSGTPEPCLSTHLQVDDVLNGDSTELVHLTWGRLLGDIVEIEVPISHAHYRLYDACIQYLRERYPAEALTPTLPKEIGNKFNPMSQLPAYFGTLVNLLADKYRDPSPELAGKPRLTSFHIQFDRPSVLEFIAGGMFTITIFQTEVAWELKTAQPDAPESDLYQAFFIDVITALWRSECYQRANTAIWSPMPWSRASVQETSISESQLENESEPFTLTEQDLAGETDPAIHSHRVSFGSPSDVLWFGAHHDGHPFCPTLASYTRLRRITVIHSLRDDAALWVSALTFGLLEAITRTRIPEPLLLVPGPDEGQLVLSGTRTLQLIAKWHSDMHLRHPGALGNTDSAHIQHGQEVMRLLTRTLHALDEEFWPQASMFRRAGLCADDDEFCDVLCSIALTVSSICGVVQCIWKGLPDVNQVLDSVSDTMRNFHANVVASCARRMHRAGWCPNTITDKFLIQLRSIVPISNLIRLPPFIRSRPDEHKHCTESSCVLYTIVDTANYVPRHVDPACVCQYTRPPLEDVVRLLSEGIVPTVIYDGARLRVQPAEDSTYVAISHVWADGMGSTTEVGLPTCQIARISKLAKQLLPPTGAFWMDSLCVPAVKELRKRAIKLMARTYRDAGKVLVIDECIRSTCSRSKSWEENLTRIATSGWVRRVWTLQEGLLARELCFEFMDGPVNVEARLPLETASRADMARGDDSKQHLNPQSCPTLVPLLDIRMTAGRGLRSGDHVALDKVADLLHLRSTTKAEDEILAISSLLPLNVDPLLAISGPNVAQERMKACLVQLREVSRNFPMDNAPRLDLPNFRWAPQSFTRATAGAQLHFGTATCTEDGLTGDYFVAAFEQPVSLPECADYHDEEESARWASMRVRSDSDSGATVFSLLVWKDAIADRTRPCSVDALLFLDGELSVTHTTVCAAVRWGCGSAGGLEAPLRLEYVAPARLLRAPVQDSKRPERLTLGTLRATRVLLT